MKKEIYLFDKNWDKDFDKSLDSENTLIICFGSSDKSDVKEGIDDIFKTFTSSKIVGCSTSGEIYGEELYTNSLSVVVIKFEKTNIKIVANEVSNKDSFDVGKKLVEQLDNDDLKGVFVLSEGLNVNGSKLSSGLNSLDKDVIITGGLAGDNTSFTKTWVIVDNELKSNYTCAVGFYGDSINIAYGSKGGWNKFGIDRMVTQANNNVLYRLDDKPALDVYKTYLGEKANELPSSGLLYPLMIKEEGSSESKVRTILGIDEEEKSITFAGDIPNGSDVMFMRASFKELIEGASQAFENMNISNYDDSNAVNIAISCVGRRLVLGQKTEDEIEAISENFGENVSQVGYYSYGEISPLHSGKCDLHNQTMTLTFIWES